MAFAELHLPLFEWVFVGATGGGGVDGVDGVVTGWVWGGGTVSVDGGDGVCWTGTGRAGDGETVRCDVAGAAALCAGRGASSRVFACGRATCGAGRRTAEECPWNTGDAGVPGGSRLAGGGWRISSERATDPATAAAAGKNDPIPAIPSFMPRLPPADSPPLDAHLSIGRRRSALERPREVVSLRGHSGQRGRRGA
jgi:hypothetical protein